MPSVVDLTSTNDQTDRLSDLVGAFSQGDRTINLGAGDYYIEAGYNVASECALPVSGKNSVTVNGADATVILKWNPANIEKAPGSATLGTLGNIFRFFNCNDLAITGLKVDYDPPLFTQGAVIAVQHATVGGVPPNFRFQPDAGFEFAWRTADFFGSYDKATGQFQETNFEDAFSDEEGGKYTIVELLVPGGAPPQFVFIPPVQPSGAAGAIPVWMAAGQQIWIAVRKRLSSPFTFVRGERLNATISLGGAAGVGIVGNGLIDPTINFYSKAKGVISGAAGGVVLLDVRGKYTSQTHESYGLGDDNLNIRTRLWDKVIIAHSDPGVSPGFIRLECRSPNSELPGNNPERPLEGDVIEFWNKAGKLVATRVIRSVDDGPITGLPNRVCLIGIDSIPNNYVRSTDDIDEWLTLNRMAVPELDLGLVKLVGGIRTLFPNSHKWTVRELYTENVRSTGFRHSFPASGSHPDYGGAKGGGQIDLMRVKNAVFRYTFDGNALINVQFCESNGTTPYSGPSQNFPPIRIDRLEVEGCGYGVTYLTGLAIEVGARVLQDTGTRRGGIPPSAPGSYDDFVQYGSLQIAGEAFMPSYRSLKGTRGEITIMPDPTALRIGIYKHAEDAGLVAYPRSTEVNIIITATFIADRTIVLSGNDAIAGDRFNIDFVALSGNSARIRNKTASPNDSLLTLAPLHWARFIFDGSNWKVEDTGSFAV